MMKNYDDEFKQLNEKITKLEDRLISLENTKKSSSSESDSSSFEMNIAKNLNSLKIPQLVIISLKNSPNQTTTQIKTSLLKWGVDTKSWFTHGHFSDYVLKKGFAYVIVKDKSQKTYSLTAKGILEYDKIKAKFTL